MRRFAIKEGTTWLALVGLTLLGFLSSESASAEVAYLALGVGLLKFFLIFYDFMEMRHAHRGWLAAMGCFVFLFSAAVVFAISAGS